MSTSVAVVDDHPMFREGVCHVLTTHGFDVVGEGATADDAFKLVSDLVPDVLVLDLTLPGGGLEAISSIVASGVRTVVLVLTVVDDEKSVLTAIRNGARGYLLKGIGGNDLVEGVRTVTSGDMCISPHLMAILLSKISGRQSSRDHTAREDYHFTEREEQILSLISGGLSNKEIAFRLELSVKTVKFYLTHILKKLHLKNRTEVALFAVKRDELDVDL